jgi:hypothetical protein
MGARRGQEAAQPWHPAPSSPLGGVEVEAEEVGRALEGRLLIGAERGQALKAVELPYDVFESLGVVACSRDRCAGAGSGSPHDWGRDGAGQGLSAQPKQEITLPGSSDGRSAAMHCIAHHYKRGRRSHHSNP